MPKQEMTTTMAIRSILLIDCRRICWFQVQLSYSLWSLTRMSQCLPYHSFEGGALRFCFHLSRVSHLRRLLLTPQQLPIHQMLLIPKWLFRQHSTASTAPFLQPLLDWMERRQAVHHLRLTSWEHHSHQAQKPLLRCRLHRIVLF